MRCLVEYMRRYERKKYTWSHMLEGISDIPNPESLCTSDNGSPGGRRRKRHPKKVVQVLQRIAEHHNRKQLPLQLVACSATVGRPMRRDLAALDDAWSLRELKILRPSGEEVLTEGERDAMKEARGGQGGGRVVGGVAAGGVLPVTIAHYYVAVKREEDKYAMLQYLLTSVCPDRPALLFLGDNLRVRPRGGEGGLGFRV
jgi:hypothetical protein